MALVSLGLPHQAGRGGIADIQDGGAVPLISAGNGIQGSVAGAGIGDVTDVDPVAVVRIGFGGDLEGLLALEGVIAD